MQPPAFTAPGEGGTAPQPVGSRVSRRDPSQQQSVQRIYSGNSLSRTTGELNDNEGALMDEAELRVVSRTAEEDESDPFLVDFSPDDPENPRNFTRTKKWYVDSVLPFRQMVAERC